MSLARREASPDVTDPDMARLSGKSPSVSVSRDASQVNAYGSAAAADEKKTTPSRYSGNGAHSHSINRDDIDRTDSPPEPNPPPTKASSPYSSRVSDTGSRNRASAATSTGAGSTRPSSAATGSRARTSAATGLPTRAANSASGVKAASMARAANTPARAGGAAARGGAVSGGAAAAIKAAVIASTMPEGQFTAYPSDIAKYLKELVRRRDEALYLRVLPKTQQLQQHVQLEASMRALTLQSELSARQAIEHKATEEREKKKEQRLNADTKAAATELKAFHAEEVAGQKALVAALQAETEKEIREKLRVVQALQPKLNPTAAVLADLKDETSAYTLLAELLDEDKKLQKALKGDARYSKSKTAETDGGALPYWWKQCIASSYNVAAIVKGSPTRAAVLDAPSVASKVAADKKIIAVRASAAEDAPVVAWAHTRVAMPDAPTVIAALLPILGVPPPTAPAAGSEEPPVPSPEANNANLRVSPLDEVGARAVFAGVLWPKEQAAAVGKAARGAKTDCGCLANHTAAVIAHGEIASYDLASSDVAALGNAAAA